MSMRANPKAIGLFMIGGILLSVIGIVTLASAAWFDSRSTFISYFGESVNGLEVGAPVKFQGVPVGNVTDLLIQIELTDKTFQVPVQYEVDLHRLTSASGTFVDLDNEMVLAQQIRDGLRAQLQMESIVTGQLYIELAYRPDAAVPELEARPTVYPEIPTAASLLSAFGTQAGSVVGDVLTILFRVNEMLEAVNMEEINRSVVASAQAVERLADSDEIRAALAEVPQMSDQFSAAMEETALLAERLGNAIEPMQEQLTGTNDEIVLTLQSMQRTLEETRGLLSTDFGVGYQLESALLSMESAADALRGLALAIERNPDMLLRGRNPAIESNGEPQK